MYHEFHLKMTAQFPHSFRGGALDSFFSIESNYFGVSIVAGDNVSQDASFSISHAPSTML